MVGLRGSCTDLVGRCASFIPFGAPGSGFPLARRSLASCVPVPLAGDGPWPPGPWPLGALGPVGERPLAAASLPLMFRLGGARPVGSGWGGAARASVGRPVLGGSGAAAARPAGPFGAVGVPSWGPWASCFAVRPSRTTVPYDNNQNDDF